MAEGQIQETLIAVGAAVVVLSAVGTILYRITVGDPQKRRLDKLKAELEAEKKK